MVVNYPMFIGEFDYRMDDKGRVPIPPKFRTDELKKEGMILCPGTDKCVAIYPLSVWTKVSETIVSGPLVSSKMRKLNRFLFGTAFNVEMDAQGRIILPSQLKQYSGVSDRVAVIGLNTYIEIWNYDLWQAEKASSQEESWHTIETMEPRE